MPSEPRKLPVLYVPTIDGAPDFDTQECDDGQTESLIVALASERYIDRYSSEREEAGFCPVVMVPYEPAVPRCRTCPNLQTDHGEHSEPLCLYCSLLGSDEMGNFPQDGSGYCHMHPEASRD
jgi:hypothetical protein